jgi:GNAT superfamily N-acetyltransferase
MITIADISDAKTITEIALQSKAIWCYSDEQLISWTDDLTVSEKMISEMFVFKFTFENTIVGFYILNQPIANSIELEFLFVLPNFIGKGIGKQLMQHSFIKAIELNCNLIHLLADPNAVPFYESKGFVQTDEKESAIFGRFLPVMQKSLAK